MRTILQIGGLFFMIMGFGLLFAGLARPAMQDNVYDKGAFATVASSGVFANYGWILMAVGIVLLVIQRFLREK